MKTIVIGDIHGRTIWKEIVNKNQDADKIIFVGDYFDSRDDILPVEQLHNFNEICNFKSAKGIYNVILLIGNHDHHYLPGILGGSTSGYQPTMRYSFEDALQKNKSFLSAAYVDENYFVYSHAGITKTWLNDMNIDIENFNINNIVSDINDLLLYRPISFEFYKDDMSYFGNNIHQSPIWVRPESLINDKIPFTQIVGHTTQDRIDSLFCKEIDIWLIDTLGTSHQYLEIIDGNIKVKTV